MAPRWTEGDQEFLNDNVGLLNYEELSRKLNRTPEAISLYRCRHNLPTFFANFYTCKLLAKELGVCRATIQRYHNRGWLIGKRANWSWAFGKYPMIFLEDNIVKFLCDKYMLFNCQSIPNIYFRNIVKERYDMPPLPRN